MGVIDELVEAVLVSTRAGLVQWGRGDDPGKFVASFRGATVVIGRVDSSPAGLDFRVFDWLGQERAAVRTLSCADEFENLYEGARCFVGSRERTERRDEDFIRELLRGEFDGIRRLGI